jgi:hypothetical protein
MEGNMITDEKPFKVLSGFGKDLELYSDKIILRGNAWLSKMLARPHTLYFKDMAEVEIMLDPVYQVGRFYILPKYGSPLILRYPQQYDKLAEEMHSFIDAEIRKPTTVSDIKAA